MIASGSELQRIAACTASAVLPRAPGTAGEPAERGSAGHEFLAAVGDVGARAALELIPPQYRALCDLIDLSSLPTGLSTEIAYTYDAVRDEAVCLGRLDQARDYPPADYACTLDVVGQDEDSVLLADWKFGHGDVTPATSNWQLKLGAICAARAHDRDTAHVEIVRLRDPTWPWHDRATFDAFDLEAIRRDLIAIRDAVLRARDTTPPPVEGEHCRYCPCYEYCPAKAALAKRATSGALADEVEVSWVGTLTSETAPDALEQTILIEQLAKRMRKIVTGYGAQHPFRTKRGTTFGPHEKRGNEKLDGDVAWHTIEREYGIEIADAAVSRSATKKAIKEALAKVEDDDSTAARVKKTLEAIREEGGASRKTTTKVEEYEEK